MANNDKVKKSNTSSKKSTVKSANKNTTSKKVTPAKKTTTKKSTVTKGTTAKKTSPKKASAKKTVVKSTSKKTSSSKSVTPKKVVIEKTILEIDDKHKVTPIKKEIIKEDIEENVVVQNDNLIRILIIIMAIVLLCGGVYIVKYVDKNKKEEKSSQEFNTDKYKEQQQMKDEDDIKPTNKGDTILIEDYSNLKTISINELSEKMDTNEEMIVYIASKTCGVCTIFEPVLNNGLKDLDKKAYKIEKDDLKTEDEVKLYKGIFDFDVTPAVSIIDKGSIKATVIGSKDRDGIKSWISENY